MSRRGRAAPPPSWSTWPTANEGGRATLVNDQRAWMNEATRKCGLPARGKPKQEIIVAAQSCVTREIHDRIPSIIRASTAYNFSQLPPAVELRCSPQTGEASIRIGSDEDEDVPPTTLPLRCELTPAHRLQIDWETTDLGAVLVHADDTLIGTAVYYGNHVMSVRDVYVSAKIETKSGKSALVVEVMGLDNICTRYSLDGLKPAEAEQHECDSSKMPPLHLR